MREVTVPSNHLGKVYVHCPYCNHYIKVMVGRVYSCGLERMTVRIDHVLINTLEALPHDKLFTVRHESPLSILARRFK